MFERFTERARIVVVLAQEESRRLGHDYVGTEHLLLGLLREEEGVAARTLNSLNVDLSAAYEQVESIVGHGDGRTGDQAPFTPDSKAALDSALREALRLGHNYVGTEHVLLRLAQKRESVAVRVLSNLGVDLEKVRRETIRTLGGDRVTVARGVARSEDAKDTQPVKVRAKVKALEVHVHCGVSVEERALPQTLRVDLEYVYEAQGDDDISGVVDYGVLLEGVAQALEGEEFQLLETGARRVGEHVLDGFRPVREVTVTVTKLHVPVARTVSGVSVEATFRR